VNNGAVAEDGADDGKAEPYMYFIRNGKFSVHVKKDHINPIVEGGINTP